MKIKCKVVGFKKGTTKAGNDSFEGYFVVDPADTKKVVFADQKDIIGDVTLTVKAWGNDANNFFKILFDEKLLGKNVALVGSMINFNFNCCLILKV